MALIVGYVRWAWCKIGCEKMRKVEKGIWKKCSVISSWTSLDTASAAVRYAPSGDNFYPVELNGAVPWQRILPPVGLVWLAEGRSTNSLKMLHQSLVDPDKVCGQSQIWTTNLQSYNLVDIVCFSVIRIHQGARIFLAAKISDLRLLQSAGCLRKGQDGLWREQGHFLDCLDDHV